MQNILISFLAGILSIQALAHPCGEIPASLGKSQSGYVEVPLDYAKPRAAKIKLYWEKFSATKGASKGAVIFLNGGPLSHHLFHGEKSPYFISDFLSDHDFYMFDYRGFNCSASIQSAQELKGIEQFFNIETFAHDFLSLKKALVGNSERVLIFGGSFGGMLGGQILISHPEHIKKAMLFSSGLDSKWFVGNLERVTTVISTLLPKNHPTFASDWAAFLSLVDHGKIILFPGKPNQTILSRDIISLYLWLYAGMSLSGQEFFPAVVKQAIGGNVSILEAYQKGADLLKLPVKPEKPPTLASSVLNYYRCNVFFPKSKRDQLKTHPMTFGDFTSNGIVSFWDEACADYNILIEQPFDISQNVKPVDVPILFWVGDRDMFDPNTSVQTMQGFGPKVDARIMAGWSHDFGSDTVAGIEFVRKMVNDFAAK